MKRIVWLSLLCVGLFILCAAGLALAEDSPRTMTLSFIGDCSLGDAVQYRTYSSSFTAAIDKHGLDWPFATASEYLLADDCTFANLEVVLTERANQKANKRYPLIGKPEFVRCLTLGGIDVVNTVNNHC